MRQMRYIFAVILLVCGLISMAQINPIKPNHTGKGKTNKTQSSSSTSKRGTASKQHKKTQSTSYVPKIETTTVNGVSFDMVWIDGGAITIDMYSIKLSDDTHNKDYRINLSGYYLGKCEVTQELWQAVMGSNPSYFSPSFGYAENLQRPVENVSWEDCQEFVTKLNQLTGKKFRLPTEAEWNFAAFGGKRSRGFKYSGSNDLEEVAWYRGNSGDRTHPVGQKVPNELGLYDMSGNVWEWVDDCRYRSSTYNICAYYCGGWSDFAETCRLPQWHLADPWAKTLDLGLRLAL